MAYVPDFSDSDFSDDDYVSYGQKSESIQRHVEKIQTPEEKLIQQKNRLYSAICSGNLANVIEILEEGIDVDVNLQSNWTPLLLAVSIGNFQITEELIKRGANSNSDRDGCTALMMACNCPKETAPYVESLKVVKCLVENGATVKVTNRKRMTPLMFATNIGNLPAVKYLLPLSDKNAEDNQRWTALFWAVNNNEVHVFKYLLNEELEYTIPDVRGNTPLDIAKSNDFSEIVALFPTEETDDISDIIDAHVLSFEDIFTHRKNGESPDFFIDICNMLCGTKSEVTIKDFNDKNVTLKNFLSITDEELKDLGIKMPYQRYRILAGIHKFHKYPFHPKSLHVVPLNESYTNMDVGIQILSTIKQLVVMESSLNYVMKHCDMEDASEEDLISIKQSIDNIKKRIQLCQKVTKKLSKKSQIWDREISPADLITSDSRRYRWPWRKIICAVTIISIAIVLKLKR